MKEIDQELVTLGERMGVDRDSPASPKQLPIPFIINFEYKRVNRGEVKDKKHD